MSAVRRFLSVRLLVLLALVLVGAGLFVLDRDPGPEPRTVTAHFSRAVSVYEGTDVRVLGVTVGRVTAVTPEGESIRVEMEYDGEVNLPEGARAAIVTPTLVADRFVQLTPVWEDGDPVMADGADIPLAESMVPVELDRIYAALRDLTDTLGPNGVNADGTLNHLVSSGANALEGQGRAGNVMLRNLADAASTFADGSGDLFETVTQLAEFTSTLAENDELVRAFMADLAEVSAQLADERGELQQTLAAVADTVGTVRSFVRDNREALVTDVKKLTRVVRAIASEKESLDQALSVAPVAMGNLVLAFDSDSGSVGSRIGLSGNVYDVDGLLCSIVQQSTLPKISKTLACRLFEQILEPITDELPPLNLPAGKQAARQDRTPGTDAPRAAPASAVGPADRTAYTSTAPPTLAELLSGEAS
jgi:phospholipid/cholesterol/gamma-HCH transport system substrate-binding protein